MSQNFTPIDLQCEVLFSNEMRGAINYHEAVNSFILVLPRFGL